jgi:hypothetical protein
MRISYSTGHQPNMPKGPFVVFTFVDLGETEQHCLLERREAVRKMSVFREPRPAEQDCSPAPVVNTEYYKSMTICVIYLVFSVFKRILLAFSGIGRYCYRTNRDLPIICNGLDYK